MNVVNFIKMNGFKEYDVFSKRETRHFEKTCGLYSTIAISHSNDLWTVRVIRECSPVVHVESRSFWTAFLMAYEELSMSNKISQASQNAVNAKASRTEDACIEMRDIILYTLYNNGAFE